MPSDVNLAAVYGGSEVFPITPHDTNPIRPVRALRVVAAGDLVFVDDMGNESTWPVDANEIIPISPVIVKTGTTATVHGIR